MGTRKPEEEAAAAVGGVGGTTDLRCRRFVFGREDTDPLDISGLNSEIPLLFL